MDKHSPEQPSVHTRSATDRAAHLRAMTCSVEQLLAGHPLTHRRTLRTLPALWPPLHLVSAHQACTDSDVWQACIHGCCSLQPFLRSSERGAHLFPFCFRAPVFLHTTLQIIKCTMRARQRQSSKENEYDSTLRAFFFFTPALIMFARRTHSGEDWPARKTVRRSARRQNRCQQFSEASNDSFTFVR